MGIRDIVAKAFKLGTPRQSFNELIEMQVPPGWGYQSYLQAYGQVGWLFACVNVISNAVARQEWHLYELSGDDEREEIYEHELLDLLHSPNRFQTRYQFMYLGTMYKKLVGEEFWQFNFNGKGQPIEAWLAPPAYMSVVPSATDYIDHYEYKRTGMEKPVNFSIDEIIHIMTPNPYSPYRGLSEAQALTSVIDSERYAASLQNKIFYNDGRPGFIIEYPAQDMPNSEARKELVQEWDERYKGYRNAGKTAFLWGGKANTLTLSPRDMDFNALRTFSRDSILGAYGVPKSVLGLTEASTFASAKAGNYTFAYYVIHPELCAIREAMNKELVPFFGNDLYLDFENPVPEDETMQVNNAVNLFKGGILTRNEARIMVEQEPLETPDGEEFFTQPSPLGLPGQPSDESPLDETPVDEEAKKKSYSESEAEEYWKAYVTRTETYEKELITVLNTIFGMTRDQALKDINEGKRSVLVNTVNIRTEYTQKANPILTKCFWDSFKTGKQLKEPENPHKAPLILNQAALDWLNSRITWAAQEIGDTLAGDLNKALIDGFNQGESIDKLTSRVMQFFDNQTRAERIARTETISASSQGAIEGYRESGIVHKVEFYTARDERTCDYCNEYHQQVFNIDEQMPIPLHPNCRCIYLPVVER